MGFIGFCILIFFLGSTFWGAYKSKEKREELKREFKKDPSKSIFVIIWVTGILMFFIGILIPVFGEKEFFDSGWEIWKVGMVITFGCLIFMFAGPNK
jgi:amino acid transporter